MSKMIRFIFNTRIRFSVKISMSSGIRSRIRFGVRRRIKFIVKIRIRFRVRISMSSGIRSRIRFG